MLKLGVVSLHHIFLKNTSKWDRILWFYKIFSLFSKTKTIVFQISYFHSVHVIFIFHGILYIPRIIDKYNNLQMTKQKVICSKLIKTTSKIRSEVQSPTWKNKSHLKNPFLPEMTLHKSQQNFQSRLKPSFFLAPILKIHFKKFSRWL